MSSLKDFVIENGVLTKYVGAGGDVVIPDGVTEIDQYAFYPLSDGLSLKISSGRTNIKSVIIPESVTKIGKYAFAQCKNLKKVTASENLTHVGARAFHNTAWKKKQNGFITLHSALIDYTGTDTEIVIPEGITSICDEAFTNCEQIVSVDIPNTVRYIGNYAFHKCTALSEIHIPESVKDIGALAFRDTAWFDAQTEDFITVNDILVAYKGSDANVVIPNTVKTIAPYVFAYKKTIQSVNIPDSVTRIMESAFSSCENLETIHLPGNITAIEDNLFFYCSNLKTAWFSENVKTIGSSAFYQCSNLEQLPDMNGITNIGDNAFNGCNKLRDEKGRIIVKDTLFGYIRPGRTVELPDEVTRISSDAFKNTEYYFDDTEDIRQIIASPAAFEAVWDILKPKNKQAVAINCLKNNTLHEPVKNYLKRNRNKIVPELILSDDAASMELLLSVSAKVNLDTIENYIESASGQVNVLSYLLNYKAQHFEIAKVEQRHEEKAEIELGLRERTLKDWKEIFKLSVTDGCIRISGYKMNESIVEIPESMDGKPVTIINDNAFKGNTTLEQVILPACIQTIGDNAFKGCSNLQSIQIPDGTESVGISAFEDCISLKSIALPNSVQQIYSSVFKGCLSLETVRLPDQTSRITSNLFDGCKALKTVALPDSITAIYDYAFRDCKALDTLHMPAQLEILGQGAFTNCKGLTELIMPDGVKEIETYVFRACTKLTKIHIPETAKKISPTAFTGCSKLTIHAPAGSRAANIAKKEKIPFVTE